MVAYLIEAYLIAGYAWFVLEVAAPHYFISGFPSASDC